ncbi:MAG: argininosuccinate lyase, partial [Armatimonadetes bacterium]|nr:argininosuccinate lyase [Armatimonadota bacterium]
VASLRFNVEAMRRSAGLNYALATDLADYLANRGVPFREAHGIVGGIVRRGIETGKDLPEFSLKEFKEFDSRIEADVFGALTVEASVAARTSAGGTSPERVREQIEQAEMILKG